MAIPLNFADHNMINMWFLNTITWLGEPVAGLQRITHICAGNNHEGGQPKKASQSSRARRSIRALEIACRRHNSQGQPICSSSKSARSAGSRTNLWAVAKSKSGNHKRQVWEKWEEKRATSADFAWQWEAENPFYSKWRVHLLVFSKCVWHTLAWSLSPNAKHVNQQNHLALIGLHRHMTPLAVEPRLQPLGKRWDVEYLGAWQNGRKGRARSSKWPGFGVGQLSGFVGQDLWIKNSKLSKLWWKFSMYVRTCKNHN